MGERIIQDNQKPTDVIVRTTILYGNSKKSDFVKAILTKLHAGEPFQVTKAISGTPTYVPHLAEAILQLCNMPLAPRIINIAGKDCISRYKFAKLIAEVFELDGGLILSTKKVVGMAQRPAKAGLRITLAKKLELPIYSVKEGLEEMRNAG
jgi:dTDP-4-dehydrorhamnose reductase